MIFPRDTVYESLIGIAYGNRNINQKQFKYWSFQGAGFVRVKILKMK
jgi:hypothetical protein